MQRRIRPAVLQENNYGTRYPSPTVRVVDVTALNGGLNLWELDYKLDANQSPDLLNVCWKDGSLSSRKGQAYVYFQESTDGAGDESGVTDYGKGYACYERPWQDLMVAHKGTKLYKISPETGEHTEIYSGLTAGYGGSFFVFGDSLYYMNGHEYVKISKLFAVEPVEAYIPLTVVNRRPDGTGGSANEDENRISPYKRVQFTTDGTSTEYHLPSGYTPLDGTGLVIKVTSPSIKVYYEKQTYDSRSDFPTTGCVNVWYFASDASVYYKWNAVTGDYETTDAPADADTFTVNHTTGVITFHTAPAAGATQTPSNLEVTLSKYDEATANSILNCSCVTVYGGDKQLAVVCGGPPAQPNAYFWSGSTTNGLDPSYFPFDYYNYAGANSAERIVGFGKQQSMLVIFKENSIGKSYFQTETVDNVEYLKLPYTPVNDSIGCNLEGSIKLVQNNLLFANTYGGVYVLLDSSSYGENTVKRISRNINGEIELGKGLLYDLSQVAATGVTAFDDRQRYWLVANGHAYLWDYTLSSYTRNEANMTWFYFDNILPVAWFNTESENFYLLANGSIAKFIDQFNDFGEAINRRYRFATLSFGTYEVLKDVLKVVLAARSDTDSEMRLTYSTDYEEREDLTPVRAYSWRLVPRNLTLRCLRPMKFAGTAVRLPRCFHVRHFAMTLSNSTLNTDMSIIQAQVFYRYVRDDR